MPSTVEAPPTELITGEALEKMPDMGRCELVEGRIVTMSPTGQAHGECEGNFYDHIRSFVRARRLGRVSVGEVGIYTRRSPDSVRGADVLFISNERYAQKKSRSFLDVAPDLVVEVLSPEDRWSEVMQKLREYFSIGVRLIWVADPESRTVYAYRSLTDIREFTLNDELPGDDVLPGFSVKVAELFED
ncbi:MAG: Uma2 family endonuclease [Acidobacteriota bacterium]